jgi:hypothetical protein
VSAAVIRRFRLGEKPRIVYRPSPAMMGVVTPNQRDGGPPGPIALILDSVPVGVRPVGTSFAGDP